MVLVVVWPPPSVVEAIAPLTDIAFANHDLLTKKMLELAAVPSGPSALFHHNALLLERMKDVKTITTRLGRNREVLTELTIRENKLRPKKRIYKCMSKQVLMVWEKSQDVHHQMKLDMESLYIFGNLLLNQWTHVIGYLVGDKEPHLFNFARLESKARQKGDRGLLESVCNKHQNDIVWLHYQLRQYRNVFVEHVNAPWQRGTSRQTYGNDFRLASPSAVGWINENEIEQEIKSIEKLAPQWARSPHETWHRGNIRELLAIAFYYIDTIKKHEHREKVWKVWEKVGGWTPSYDITAARLLRFVSDSILTVTSIISTHPNMINVGAAAK